MLVSGVFTFLGLFKKNSRPLRTTVLETIVTPQRLQINEKNRNCFEDDSDDERMFGDERKFEKQNVGSHYDPIH